MKFFKKFFKKDKEEEYKRKRRKKKKTKNYALKNYMKKAGFSIHHHFLSRSLFKITLIINVIISLYLLYFFATREGFAIGYIFLVILLVWGIAFFLLLGFMWFTFYIFLDFKIFRRKLNIEEVLPDFLFLTATNIRSGMTIDKALWFAVRPRFGILSKEIEIVAKEVMSGEELTESLQKFANKYDSDILKRSINLLIEGIKSGGEIGDLLTRIAGNIQESRLLRKEMAANVTTYVIFITFAAIVAAPVLLALSNQLIIIIGNIVSRIDMPTTGNLVFAITNISVTPENFQMFAYISLSVTAFFSSIIVASIKKGNIKEGIKYIPMYIVISIVLFLLSNKFLNGILSQLFM